MSPWSTLGRFSIILALMLAPTLRSGARAQEWQTLPDKTQVANLEGKQVRFVIRPEVRFFDNPKGGIDMSARARARLDELQTMGPDILGALASNKSNCETRWSFPQLAPVTLQGGKLRIEGQLHAEQWLCVGPVETVILEATADFVITLSPIRRDQEVAVDADLERFDVHGPLSPLSDALRDFLSSFLHQTVERDDMKFTFPPEVASVNPRFTGAHLDDVGSRMAELSIEATALVRAADMARILALITK